jgi:hypothetical protein
MGNSPSCGNCIAELSVGGARMDPAATASLIFANPGMEVARTSVSGSGATALRLDRQGVSVRYVVVDCCDCLVEELRILDVRTVADDSAALGLLKARYHRDW